MTQCQKFSSTMVRGAARLHAEQTRQELHEERLYLRSPELLADHNRARSINAVELENAFGQINADG